MSSPGATPPPRPVRGLGPVIVVILILIAALLGYYQIIYYPPNHTSTSTQIVPPDPHNVTVTIASGASSDCSPNCAGKTYVPDTMTVVIGYNATVIWRNDDGTVHTVTADANDSTLDPRFTSFGPTSPSSAWNNIPSGKSVNFTFIKPGTYGYLCSYHPWMVGSVIVKSGTNVSSSSSASTSGPSSSALIGPYHINPFTVLREGITTRLNGLTYIAFSSVLMRSFSVFIPVSEAESGFSSKI
jgi:plastocyanin